MSSENEINTALRKAVENGKVDEVHVLLFHDADPNYSKQDERSLLEIAMKQNDLEILKLLVQYGASIKEDQEQLAEFVFLSKNIHRSKELVAHLFKYHKNTDLLEDFFYCLNEREDLRGTTAVEIFKLLLDLGLPIDEFICTDRPVEEFDSYTVLHFCILEDRADFVHELLRRGADIHVKTGMERNCLFPALWYGALEPMIKLLVKKGLDVNERSIDGATLLHLVCHKDICAYPHNVHLLCKYGADLNLLEDSGNTCLMNTTELDNQDKLQDMEDAVIEELAILRFENQFICPENLVHINKFEESREFFDDCLVELQRIKSLVFYRDISLYDVVYMSKRHRTKLISNTRNKDFVTAFEFNWDRELFKHYADYLDDIFNDALGIRDSLLNDEKILRSVFKHDLPELATRKIAYFYNEHLFF